MKIVKFHCLLLVIFLCFSHLANAQKQAPPLKKSQIVTFKAAKQAEFKAAKTIVASTFSMSDIHPDLNLKATKTEDQLGLQHHRFESKHQAIPIEFGDYVVHEKAGKIYSISGIYLNLKDLNTTASKSAESCLEEVLNHLDAQKYLWEEENPDFLLEGYTKPEGELMILPVIDGANSKEELVYKFTIYTTQPLYYGDFYVSAHTGEIVFEHSKHYHTSVPGSGQATYEGNVNFTAELDNGEYRLQNTSITSGGLHTYNYDQVINNTLVGFEVTSTSSIFSDQNAVQAHFAGEQAINYFQQRHNWDSYDNNGGEIKIMGDFSGNNAGWLNNIALIGTGDGINYTNFGSMDIIGHEITHGVIEHTAGLIYNNESGALNESFADIFGKAIDFSYSNSPLNWRLGDQVKIGQDEAVRSMKDPNLFGQPDTYFGLHYYHGNGGVHTNSGVQNFWFYLLAQSGVGNNDFGHHYAVEPIGREKAAQIAFRNLSVYLTPSSTYWDARIGSIQSAIDLYGLGSWEEISVTNAWQAVGVGPAYASPNNCYSGTVTLTIKFDDDPTNIGWFVKDTDETALLSSAFVVYNMPGHYNSSYQYTTITETINITQDGRYKFTIVDQGQNGLCCNNTPMSNNGSYEIRIGTTLIASGDIFDLSDGREICINADIGPETDLIRPTVPANITVSNIMTTTATFDWDDSSDNVNILGYAIFFNGVPDPNLVQFSQGTPPAGYFSPNTTYTVEVYALDRNLNYSVRGPSVQFTTLSNTAPSAPTNLTASNVTYNSFDLNWNASSSSVGIAHYEVYIDGNLESTTTSTNRIILNNITPSTSYSCHIVAIDVNGQNSAFSNTINVTTLPQVSLCTTGPLTLRITFDGNAKEVMYEIKTNQNVIQDRSNYLEFADSNQGDVENITIPVIPNGDYVLRLIDIGGDGLCCANGNGKFELFGISGPPVLSGDVYQYSNLQAFCIGNTNNDVFDLTPPTTPVLTVGNPTSSSLDVSWTPSFDANLIAYQIFMNGQYLGQVPSVVNGFPFSPLSSGTSYSFMIIAEDRLGNFSLPSNIATGTTLSSFMAPIIQNETETAAMVRERLNKIQGEYLLQSTPFEGVSLDLFMNNLSLDQNELTAKAFVFPNPSEQTISLGGIDLKQVESVTIYDIHSRKMLESAGTQNIDISTFSSGIYQLLIRTVDQTTQSILFVKKR